jgi:hypothetical protein
VAGRSAPLKRILAALFALAPAMAGAHVGLPDVLHQGHVGPYKVLVSVSPPEVIPGVAQVEIETNDRDLVELRVLSMPLSGEGAKLPPTPDVAQRTAGTPVHFSARLWLMSAGAWQVRLLADGGRGAGELSVPVPALPSRTKGMDWKLGAALLALMALLFVGAVSIIGAGTAEGQLPPGQSPEPQRIHRARWARIGSAVLLAAALIGARAWWRSEADAYRRIVYRPIRMEAAVEDGALRLTVGDPGWLRARRTDDWMPDHGHLMHLYVISEPGMERVWHLHPKPEGANVFRHALPPGIPAGRYRLFADLVHATGLAETAVAEVDLPAAAQGSALEPDDAAGEGPPLAVADASRYSSPLSVGRMLWLNGGRLAPERTYWLRFRVEDAPGQPTAALEPYMGMLGHAAIVRDDASVFAHIHPSGSVAMASLAVAGGMEMAAPPTPGAPGAAEVDFPFRFPRPGLYRLIVQVKRQGTIETGLFSADVGL